MAKKPLSKEAAALLEEMDEFAQVLDKAVESSESLSKVHDAKMPKFPASGNELDDAYPDLAEGV